MQANESALFWVWGIDHVAYGPVELPILVSWIKAGRILADTWVFPSEKENWFRAEEVPELKLFFQSKPEPSAASAPGPGIKPGTLRRIRALADMDEKQLESLLHYLEVVRCSPFTLVVREGEHGDAMFLVLEGELRARTLVTGKETTLATISPGETFGEISLLDHGPRSVDVIANTESVLVKISAAAFNQILREAPALATPLLFALSKEVVRKVRSLTKKYEDSIHLARAASDVH